MLQMALGTGIGAAIGYGYYHLVGLLDTNSANCLHNYSTPLCVGAILGLVIAISSLKTEP